MSDEGSVPPPAAQGARLAASVLLIRDGERGLEVFLQRRAAGKAFAPDVTAFPGGGVDPRDHESQVSTTGTASLGSPFGHAAPVGELDYTGVAPPTLRHEFLLGGLPVNASGGPPDH
jgi:hypothetical protein